MYVRMGNKKGENNVLVHDIETEHKHTSVRTGHPTTPKRTDTRETGLKRDTSRSG